MVDAIIDSCEVTRKETGATNSTHIIHTADMGFRLPLANNFDSVNNLFKKCKEMEEVGLQVELTQFDVAFVFQSPPDHLFQTTCQMKGVPPRDSLFQKSRVMVYPIHKVPKFSNDTLKTNELGGTFEIKKTSWETGRNVILDDDMQDSCCHQVRVRFRLRVRVRRIPQ